MAQKVLIVGKGARNIGPPGTSIVHFTRKFIGHAGMPGGDCCSVLDSTLEVCTDEGTADARWRLSRTLGHRSSLQANLQIKSFKT